MSSKRDNCIILLIEPPVTERIDPEFVNAFGAERAVHIHLELLQNAYKLAKNFKDSILILSFDKSPRHPDLTWLDTEDPGFLEAKGKNSEDRITEAFQLAFNTGAKKVLLLSHLSPEVKSEWLYQAFDSVAEKTLALGLNQDGSIYLVGLTLNNLKVLERLSFISAKTAEEITEHTKKNKLGVFSLPEAYAVKNEENLRKWMESRDSAQSLFKAPSGPGAAPHEEKKHGGRGHKNPASQPQPLPGAERKPL
ncbi:MAG: hypothetical protein A2270_06740 [Elusimicrobia bacterium RIFOXYA12_FULL_51_18]|nr:MAG: hypothetical protein A2270_06740 [Elusimicrobia bacterium RIFOXYA12_FULL_51_18]OGS30623.1 MAG: hypothetical protein A2218_06055 [Elusimicrobia bacterium RIFOXYA2_FULL_53_38]